jgi:hypothetical protein
MPPATMTHSKEPVVLPSEDRNRMCRLYEEVWVRLEEMAMITARTLKMNAGRSMEIRFQLCESSSEFDLEAVELVRTARGRGCYDYRRGSCFEFPGAGAEPCPTTESRKI